MAENTSSGGDKQTIQLASSSVLNTGASMQDIQPRQAIRALGLLFIFQGKAYTATTTQTTTT